LEVQLQLDLNCKGDGHRCHPRHRNQVLDFVLALTITATPGLLQFTRRVNDRDRVRILEDVHDVQGGADLRRQILGLLQRLVGGSAEVGRHEDTFPSGSHGALLIRCGRLTTAKFPPMTFAGRIEDCRGREGHGGID
jgi:hypothetical protein